MEVEWWMKNNQIEYRISGKAKETITCAFGIMFISFLLGLFLGALYTYGI